MKTPLDPGKPNLDVYIDNDNMINLVLGGNISEDYLGDLHTWAEGVKEAMKKSQASSKDGKVYTLIDISTLDQFDQKTLEVIRELMEFNKNYATRTATWGGSLFSVMAQDMLALMTHRDNLKAFRTKEDALEWLHKKAV